MITATYASTVAPYLQCSSDDVLKVQLLFQVHVGNDEDLTQQMISATYASTVSPHLQLTFFQYSINRSFLLIMSGDVEVNPGPGDLTKCPCKAYMKDELTLKCITCKQAWHVSCVGLNEITSGALSKLKSWKCILCIDIPVSIKSKLEESLKENILPLKEVIENMERNVMQKIEEIKETRSNATEDTPYKDAMLKNLERKVTENNRLVRNQIRQTEDRQVEPENLDCKRVVLQPKDVNIRNSKDLRKKFNEYYPNILLKHATISAGGSYVFHFDEEDAANQVQGDWKKEHFGGNAGLVKFNDRNRTGLVKFVYDDIDVEEIENEIKRNYPDIEKYELFKNKDDEFTGMIKVTFKEENDLQNVIANKFDISHRKYIVEKFKHKPKVIKCNVCQRFGHVSRLCRSKDNPRCGKCSVEGHETKDCTADATEYKCFHCGLNDHITGSYKCVKVQEKYKELLDRLNYG